VLVTFDAWVASQAASIRAEGRWRELPNRGEQDLVSFASNDYLGLSRHPDVVAAAHDALSTWGTGAGSSPLIAGHLPLHRRLEARLAGWRQVESALVFASGYQANVAVLTTFGAGALIVSDELNHASIIDGARLARGQVSVYRHRDVDHAAELVRDAPGRAVVVTDTVFSMDGDVAPLTELSTQCARYGALLVVDDAHAVFEPPPVDPDAMCVRVGTLSKTLGSQGGYVAGSAECMELLVNQARPLIFSTALAPACAAAARAAVDVIDSAEGRDLKRRLRLNIDIVRSGHPSPIVPLVLGDEQTALNASKWLSDAGLLVPAIRPPTVAPGTCRLRVSLSAVHAPEAVTRLRQCLDQAGW
jgi:8-amino-7-oxononanoate synthase